MSTYYVKLADDPTFWLVRDGKRRKMANPQDVRETGLFELRHVTPEELEAIPLLTEGGQHSVLKERKGVLPRGEPVRETEE